MEKETKYKLEQLQAIYNKFKNTFTEEETLKIEKLITTLELKAQEETLTSLSQEIECILEELSNYSVEDIEIIIWSYYMSIKNPNKMLITIKELQEIIIKYKQATKIPDNKKARINRGVQSLLRLKIKRLLELLKKIKMLPLSMEILNNTSDNMKNSLTILIPSSRYKALVRSH